MEKINIVELLKDCPRGMELDCVMFDNVTLWEVEEGTQFPITIKVGVDDMYLLTEYGEWNDGDINAKCVIFPKGKTTWEGFIPPYKFKEGDVVSAHIYAGSIWIGIFKQANTNSTFEVHCSLDTLGKFHTNSSEHLLDNTHLATKEEKERLFKVIKSKGYKWNPETKTLDKLVVPKFKVGDRVKCKKGYIHGVVTEFASGEYKIEYNSGTVSYADIKYQDEWELVSGKFDINILKPYKSKVLARDAENDEWKPCMWGIYDKGHNFPYVTTGLRYRYCIPYEGNEYLLGKTDDCDNFFKTWKD